jgi:GNAT superfamily N-acetyltransferase
MADERRSAVPNEDDAGPPDALRYRFERATVEDVPALVALRSAVAHDLTARHGPGHWSTAISESGVKRGVTHSLVTVARDGDGTVLATLRLGTPKPWAIDVTYFTPCARPLYLTDMAVHPSVQCRGIGRRSLLEARRLAGEWPADAIRLDAYDAEAGAGGFYARCGFREVARIVYRNSPLIYYELVLGDRT